MLFKDQLDRSEGTCSFKVHVTMVFLFVNDVTYPATHRPCYTRTVFPVGVTEEPERLAFNAACNVVAIKEETWIPIT